MRRFAVIIIGSLLLLACGRSKDMWTAKPIVAMKYPALGTAARIQGAVKVVAIIDSNGNVQDVMPSPIITYTFKLEGATRRQRKQEFVFEPPGAALIVSEAMCPDHLPCNEEEAKAWEKHQAHRINLEIHWTTANRIWY